ncbi:MAG TPA: hypothetical protein VFZ16_08570 [Hyphomicrobiaceae bacterium]|nr:hypothetical protein [Hyphomicrobiaceae bacterium]
MKTWGSDAQAVRDAAVLLPIAGAVLLMPPLILVFAAPVLIAGIPLIVIYVFGAWVAIILGAWLLARRHAREPGPVIASVGTSPPGGEPRDPGRS